MRNNKNAEKVSEKIKTVLEELQKFVSSETVVGKPIKSDGITIIPLVDVTFGVGFGFNGKTAEDVQGGGIGGSMSPNSLLIIENGTTKLVSIKDSNSITALIPQIMDRLDFDFIKKDGNQQNLRYESDEE